MEILTNDEKKAAEAAFARRPFNPAWSEKARLVYEGILHALPASRELLRNDGTEGNAEEVLIPNTTDSPSGLSSSDQPTKEENDAVAAKIPV
ncbi:MAG TPA: hypothetical protein VJ746_09740 [Nitrospira sp.]|nr:hypothetical protein [Nitrospira sp.]